MIIRLRKNAREPVMTCTRDDGSVTYMKTRHGGFFPRHDLMHYAVEEMLGLKNSFYGLVAAGWSLDAFSQPGVARRLPLEAKQTEFIVGELDRLIAFNEPIQAEAVNAFLKQALKNEPITKSLSQEQLDAICSRFKELFARYRSMGEGDNMELVFEEESRVYSRLAKR